MTGQFAGALGMTHRDGKLGETFRCYCAGNVMGDYVCIG